MIDSLTTEDRTCLEQDICCSFLILRMIYCWLFRKIM